MNNEIKDSIKDVLQQMIKKIEDRISKIQKEMRILEDIKTSAEEILVLSVFVDDNKRDTNAIDPEQ